MNMLKKGHLCSILLALLALGVLLTACGTDSPTGQTTQTVPGVVTVGTATAGFKACTSCHTTETADWMQSRHANMESYPSYTWAAIPECTGCHDKQGDGVSLSPSRMVVGCEACHSGGKEHVAAGGAAPIGFAVYTAGVISGATSTVPVSGQFATCTACHQLLDVINDPANAATTTAEHDALGGYPLVVSSPTNSNLNSITDTHYATPNSWLPAPNNLNSHNSATDFMAIFGYAMDYADEKVCSNCHNPHKNPTINRDWAQSAHADRQGIKIDSRSGAFVGVYSFSSAWAHYNWSTRPECQRCHTTTGFTAFADALRSGNASRAEAIRKGAVQSVPSNTFFKPEMLKCNGCHTDNRGTLRNPGAITATYDLVSGANTLAKASHSYPNVYGSNVCMACHTGREIGDTIKGINDPELLSNGTITSVDFSKRGFINSHYLTAGATVFRVSGYTYEGRDYSNLGIYMHDKIGTPAAPNTGSNGPCAGCHMSRPNKNGNHLFLPVTRIASGDTVTITGIASEVCFRCHGPNDLLMRDLVQEQRMMFKESLEALRDALDMRGYYFADFSPYFYTLRDRTSALKPATVTVTNGSPIVTLNGDVWSKVTGTTFPNSTQDRFRVNDDGQFYSVEVGATSGNSITLQAPYAGPSNGAAEYTIIGSSAQSWLTTTTPFYPVETVDTDKTGATTGKNNMGAAFNFNLLEHDPGAYAHNRYYVKRLIYDSIDWLDDNQMNYSVGVTLSTTCTGGSAPVWCAGALEYLLPNGVLGIAAERP